MRFILFLFLISIIQPLFGQVPVFNKTYDLDVIWEWGLGLVERNGHYYMLQQKIGSTYPENRLILLDIDNNGMLQNSIDLLCTDSSICSPAYQGLIHDSENILLIYGEYREHPDSLSDGFIARYDLLNDSIIQFKRYGGTNTQGFLDLKKHPEGGYIACGGDKAIDDSGDIYAIRLDNNLETIWETTIPQLGFQFAYTIDYIEESGYFLVGKGLLNLGTAQIIAMKLDNLGHLEWYQILGGNGNNDGRHTGKVLNDGNLLVAANKRNNSNTDFDSYMIKLNLEGEIIWEQIYAADTRTLFNTNIIELDDGSIVVGGGKTISGTRYSRIVKFTAEGETIWEQLYHGRLPHDSYFYGIAKLDNEEFIAYGSTRGNDPMTQQDGWLVKMDSEGQSCADSPDCLLVNIAEVEASGNTQLTVSPNPVYNQALLYYYLPEVISNCSIQIYDLSGRLQFSELLTQAAQEGSVQLDVSTWPKAMYLVQIRSQGQILATQKLLVQ